MTTTTTFHAINPLDYRTQIVDPETGCPSSQFIRLWQQMFGNGSQTKNTADAAAVASRQIITGTGLTGGGDLTADRTLALAATAVAPAIYGDATHYPQFTVDQQGRLTQAANLLIPVLEAPMDGRYYARRNGAWIAIVATPA